jgi:hypothetical protein
METITAQVVAQEKQNNGHKQLITDVEKKAEVDIEWLRSDFDVQKVRNNQLEAYIASLHCKPHAVSHRIRPFGHRSTVECHAGSSYTSR